MQNSKDSGSSAYLSKLYAYIFMLTTVTALLVVRGALFYFESWDYLSFLRDWVIEQRSMSFIKALGARIGDYNPPYMYILNIISRIDVSELYLIKTVSVIFDFLLAFAIPTVILNSSMWGQCDSIYTSFAVGSVYFALRGRGKTAYTFIAIALSFKLQAAFILPIFAVFVFTKKIRLMDCYMFFIVYFAMLFPALLAGMPINDLLSIYLKQSDSYHLINLNSINIWQLVGNIEFMYFRVVALFMCGSAVLGLLYYAYEKRDRLIRNVDFIRLAYLFAAFMPFLLPQMHDRFFYMADVLSLTVFLYDKRRWYVPVVAVFCSHIAYTYYLMEWAVLVDYKLAALALMFMLLIVLRDLVISLSDEELSHRVSKG